MLEANGVYFFVYEFHVIIWIKTKDCELRHVYINLLLSRMSAWIWFLRVSFNLVPWFNWWYNRKINLLDLNRERERKMKKKKKTHTNSNQNVNILHRIICILEWIQANHCFKLGIR